MAVRIILKRSSIPNKRPNADLLEPGEVALNTNALTPGLFFESDNNAIVKVGPTSVGLEPPTFFPSLGETDFNPITRALKIGGTDPETLAASWLSIATPFLGGTNGYVVFVAPEFPTANDDILNDGQSAPYQTINRAVIEIAKQSISINNESDSGNNARFTIVVAPGIVPAINGPGASFDNFNVNFESLTPSLPQVLVLQQFNSADGGVFVPRGTSIIGMDLRKVEIRPCYVPSYQNPTTLVGVNQPLSSIIKWTGNSYISELSFRDKREVIQIESFSAGPAGEGTFVSSRPHCFGLNDAVLFEFADGTDQRPISPTSAEILPGTYYVFPVTVDSFYLSFTPITADTANFIERSQLPASPQTLGFLATCYWQGVSHNRLRAISAASSAELSDFYVKVQRAFPVTFTGRTNQAEVINPGETEIVGPVPLSIEESFLSNTTNNASPYIQNASLRSNYGMCGLVQDGDIVSGFRSALVGGFNVISLQNDPVAYEIYTTVQDPVTLVNLTGWYTLQYATWASLSPAIRPASPNLITTAQQLGLLNSTQTVNIRYLFSTLKSFDGQSFGIPDENNDFRHFAIKVINRGFAQVNSCWAVGCAVGFWAMGGGQVTVTGSSTNFGFNALRSEGFYKIGSNAFSANVDPFDSGFIFAGIRMPDKIQPAETTNYKAIEMGGTILSVINNGDVQEITLGNGFQPINILPYSLAVNTAVYSESLANQQFRAFFIDDGLPTAVTKADGTSILRVRAIDSTFPLGSSELNPDILNYSSPFIKRFLDPRTISEASYSLILQNTEANHRAPVVGSILQLNQNSSSSTSFLRPGVQFDPGQTGGWGRIFKTAFVETALAGNSPQFNEVMLNETITNSYYVYPSIVDTANPWLDVNDHAHGSYVTYNNRNWYAACNDEWNSVYYNSSLAPSGQIKLYPAESGSPWATSFSSELQQPVSSTYQGAYAPDPQILQYPNGTYFRGDTFANVNFSFELVVNIDNGTENFGLLRSTLPTGVIKTTVAEFNPLSTSLEVNNVTDIPNPLTNFVVVQIKSGINTEYLQVIGIDEPTDTLIVLRNLYNSALTSFVFPIGATVTLQTTRQEVFPEDYDFDWSISKSTMIRFLTVMGYSPVAIQNLLRPRSRSSRNVLVQNISDQPGTNVGYALATGPWPLQFVSSSRLDVTSHNFHSVGRFTYSRGLPNYLQTNITTKQYFDYMSTQLWGGSVITEGSDELGNLTTNGEAKQSETGRPSGTFTSDITVSSRVDAGEQTINIEGVKTVFTGTGLFGGPIVNIGTISLAPSTTSTIGGVKPGLGLTVTADGTLNSIGGGSVTSITAGIGLEGGTITSTGTIDLKPPTPFSANGPREIGGIYPAFGLNFDPDNGDLNVNITDDLNGTAKNFAISQFAANALEKQIQALVGVNVLAGTFNALTGKIVTVSPAGTSKGFVVGQNVPPPSLSIDNYFLIVTVGGNGAQPPLPPGPSQPADWYICQSEVGTAPQWMLIDYDYPANIAENIVINEIPGIETAGNVQVALQDIELQVQDRIEFVQVQDEDNTNALFADVTVPLPTANDGTTLKIGVTTADELKFGVTKLTSDYTGTSLTLALNQAGAAALNGKVDALVGANVLAGTYDSIRGVVLTVTPAGSRYLIVNQQCPTAANVPDNFYVLVTTSGKIGPPGAVIPPKGVQSGDWFVVEREVGQPSTWVTIDFENTVAVASQVKLQPVIPGIASDNVQGALEEVALGLNKSFTDIISFTGNSSGIKVTNTVAQPNGRQSTLQLLPATSQDIGGVFVTSGKGLDLTASGGLALLPATTTALGGVIIGTGLSVTPSGVLSATGAGTGSPVTLVDNLSAQFNGITTTFSLLSLGIPLVPGSAIQILVTLGGIIQNANSAYTVAGSQITFSEAPKAGTTFYAICFQRL